MKIIKSKSSLNGVILVPGDKSISHRAIILSSISKGTSVINNFLFSQDCISTINCFKQMGINIIEEKSKVLVEGKGLYGLKDPKAPLFVGNSGTTIRLLTGILANQTFNSKLIGDSSLNKRPMERVISPLSKMGANIVSSNGYAPLNIFKKNGVLSSINYELPIPSAQVKSAIILASLYSRNITTIKENSPCRNHTELMLKYFGGNIFIKNNKIICTPVKNLYASEIFVPGDISSASFFIVAGLILKNSHIIIKNIGINPTRIGLIKVLKDMGGNIKFLNKRVISNEQVADIEVKSSNLNAITISGNIIPKMIDEIPIFAVACLFAKGTSIIKDASELKFKESNRINTISTQLNKMGANIIQTKDGMIISSCNSLKGTEVDSFNDHRVAMSLAIAGILANGETYINNSNCVDISFPNFFKILDNL